MPKVLNPSHKRHSHDTLSTYDCVPWGLTDDLLNGGNVIDQRKQAVSIRLGDGDIRNIKRIARRLGVRDSDVIRFAIKSTLSRLAPLCDPGIRGRNLVPVLVESGDEVIRYFELDAVRLEAIINQGVDSDRQVECDDIALLAMSGLREEYLVMRMLEGNSTAADAGVQGRLRRYLYNKYVYRHGEHSGGPITTNGHGPVHDDRNFALEPVDSEIGLPAV